ncbi:tRNA 4-thiouridine(8) synthase ThiI [bacterium]|nr:tRNA 4-thiouridine(8) synthase ThiI [bacterium]
MVTIVIRYSELALKGKNRNWFEDLLVRNIRNHLSSYNDTKVSKVYGRIIVETAGDADKVSPILRYIPGIANFSVAQQSNHEMENLSTIARDLVKKYVDNYKNAEFSFKVISRRAFKRFPINSQELSAQMGGVILEQFPNLKVDLHQPDLELGIEIWQNNRAILYLEKTPGLGGLPSGSSGNVISFISGGIDSPVSSWFMIKRGCVPIYLHFHSYPFIGEQSRQKVIDLVTHLSRYQPKSTLIIVPFAEIQKAIKESCNEKNRTILYRRLMFRVAEEIKQKYKALAYVTGEAVGQVASQTLENIACTEAVASVPVIRPLIGMDKTEIISWAKKIGTYEISIQPFPDCCTVFQPRKPEIHGKVSYMAQDEQKLNIDELLSQALENMEILHFETQVLDKFLE